MRAAGVRQSVGFCTMETGPWVMWSRRFFPPQGWFLRTANSLLNTSQFNTFPTVSWPPSGRLIYSVNGSSPGAELCNNLHLLYPALQYIMCGDFRCDISSCVINLSLSFFRFSCSLMMPDSRGGGDRTDGAASWLTAGCHSAEVTSSVLDRHRGRERVMEKRYGDWLFIACGRFFTFVSNIIFFFYVYFLVRPLVYFYFLSCIRQFIPEKDLHGDLTT